MRKEAEQIFLAGVDSVLPDKLIDRQITREGDLLVIAGNRFSLSRLRHIYLLAAGKAAALMAKEAEKILGNLIADGQVITKSGHGLPLERLTLTEAGHPIPDRNGVEATQQMLDIAQKAGKDDLVIFLISGGASALMADYPEGATLEDLKKVNGLLVRCGADIAEINTVRKHLSAVKGGQLARAAAPAQVVSLILSDVIGDRTDVIASGPTVPDPSTFADALAVIEKYALEEQFPASMLMHLRKGAEGLIPETPEPGDSSFLQVQNHVIGSNRLALEGAARKARKLGYETFIITDALQGDYTDVAGFILDHINQQSFQDVHTPRCLLFGGEPTLKVTGNGLGGRNQHLALWLATKITHLKNITILCAGTDGNDGPTDAAGAVVDSRTLPDAWEKHIDTADHLSRFDSYHFFQQAGGHIITGNTRTNVMDMVVVLMS
jgi:hydroxypyruvate reductase/glycerate 2-kinase